MSAASVSSGLIHQWICKVFQSEIKIIETAEKTEGYISNVEFAKVIAEHGSGQKLYNVIIKYAKTHEQLPANLPVRQSFQREIFIYSQVFPEFRKLKGNFLDQLIPKCFGTIFEEVLILENLKAVGYSLHDNLKPFDLSHLNLTLENYGKLHALSFALKQKKPKEFAKLFDEMQCVNNLWACQMRNLFQRSQQKLYDVLELNEEMELVVELKRMFSKTFFEHFMEVLQVNEDKTVLIHGDCWNDNFMFKYQENQPVSCKFLDFQVSRLATPIFDLSYHIFATASQAELQQLEHTLGIYHQSLCQHLKKLGISADIFTFDDVMSHWRKYSVFGFINSCLVALLHSSSKDDVVEQTSKVFDTNIEDLKVENRKRFSPRIVIVTKTFLKWSLV